MSAGHFWRCARPGCSGLVYRAAGAPATCPRCGDAIATDLRSRVEATRAESARRKARRRAATREASAFREAGGS